MREGVVGVVPAAGQVRRLGSPSSSKELIEVYPDPRDGGAGALPVCYRVLHALHDAQIHQALVVSRSDKADLRARLAGGSPGTPELRHLELSRSPSAAFSVAAATTVAAAGTVALGFPDVLWTAEQAFQRLLDRLEAGADVALGLFPPAEDYATVAIEVDPRRRVWGFHPRSECPECPAWTLAVWRPHVSRFLEQEVHARYPSESEGDAPLGSASPGAGGSGSASPGLEDAGLDGSSRSTGSGLGGSSRSTGSETEELGLTEIFERALKDGFRIDGVVLSDQPFLDIGEPARLEEALRRLKNR